jgi:transcriptional regulator with XRE-family HTH domain
MIIFFRGVLMSLFENVKSLCKREGIKVETLSASLGWGVNSIYRWDKTSPSVDKVVTVAKYFDVSVESLLAETYTVTDPSNKEELKKFITSKGNEPYIILSAKAHKSGISPETLEALIELHTKK